MDQNLKSSNGLLSRHGIVVTQLAKRFLSHSAEERILSVVEHSQELGTSVGTVQSAINYLQDQGAIELEARGRLGTFIRALDYSRLWLLAHNRPLVGALPLPTFIRLAGLASGIRATFNKHQINLDLRYIRGATKRLQALSSRMCDWTIVSGFAADSAHLQGFEIEPIVSFGPNTFTVNQVMLFGDTGITGIEDGMRMGVDYSSIDHTYMVHSVCREKRVDYVNINFSEGIKLLRFGEIDATCWQADDVPEGLCDITVIPIQSDGDHNICRVSEAVVVTLPNQSHVKPLLNAILDKETVTQVQSRVVSGECPPSF